MSEVSGIDHSTYGFATETSRFVGKDTLEEILNESLAVTFGPRYLFSDFPQRSVHDFDVLGDFVQNPA